MIARAGMTMLQYVVIAFVMPPCSCRDDAINWVTKYCACIAQSHLARAFSFVIPDFKDSQITRKLIAFITKSVIMHEELPESGTIS